MPRVAHSTACEFSIVCRVREAACALGCLLRWLRFVGPDEAAAVGLCDGPGLPQWIGARALGKAVLTS
jgi:hypothetical protein